jgi:hypothetical protein
MATASKQLVEVRIHNNIILFKDQICSFAYVIYINTKL